MATQFFIQSFGPKIKESEPFSKLFLNVEKEKLTLFEEANLFIDPNNSSLLWEFKIPQFDVTIHGGYLIMNVQSKECLVLKNGNEINLIKYDNLDTVTSERENALWNYDFSQTNYRHIINSRNGMALNVKASLWGNAEINVTETSTVEARNELWKAHEKETRFMSTP